MTTNVDGTLRVLLAGAAMLMAAVTGCKPSAPVDSAGRAVLVFEIETEGLDGQAKQNLAEDMKHLLRERADPKGLHGLRWRALSPTRLEVQMPLPSRKAWRLREAYKQALEDLFSEVVTRADLETALQKTGPERTAAIKELARGSVEQERLGLKAAEAYDSWVAARDGPRPAPESTQPTTAPEPRRPPEDLPPSLAYAEVMMDDAFDAFLTTDLDRKRFMDTLEMGDASGTRGRILEEFKSTYPELAGRIDNVIAKHRAWCAERTFLSDPDDLKRLVRAAGVLEFRILPRNDLENVSRYDRYRRQLQERGSELRPGDEFAWFKVDNPVAFFDRKTYQELDTYDLTTSPFVADRRGSDYYVLAKLGPENGLLHDDTWRLQNAYVDQDQRGRPSVAFQLDVAGAKRFETLTGRNIDQPLCILVDNIAYSAPNIKSKIGMYGMITGDFGQYKAAYLAQTMQAGSLPIRLTLVSESVELKPAE